jgi:hypothetical protein
MTTFFHEFGQSIGAGTIAFLGNATITGGTSAGTFEAALPILVQSGAVGLLSFVLWHIFAKFIPRLMDSHEAALKAYREELAEARKAFADALREIRDDREK